MDSLRACMLYLLGCVKICNKCASPLPTWLRQIIANGFRCLFIIALWLHHFFLFFPPPDDQWSTKASITSGVFIWCRLWSGYQLGGEVINYPTLSIKRRGYQLSHVINYPLDNLSNEPIMENRPNYVLDQPYGTPPLTRPLPLVVHSFRFAWSEQSCNFFPQLLERNSVFQIV